MCICGGVVVRARRDVVRADWGEGVGIWGGSGGGESAAFGTFTCGQRTHGRDRREE
jgi:hypothetical protein